MSAEDRARDIPVIDISPLVGGDVYGSRTVAAALRRACTGTGFFYVANHGVTRDAAAGAFADAKRFFDQSLAAKERITIRNNTNFRGYTGLRGQVLDRATGGDIKESMYLGLDLPTDDPLVVAGTPHHGPNQWPEGLPGWREAVLSYYGKMETLARTLINGLAMSLDLSWGYFDASLDRAMMSLRLLHYPPHPESDPGREVGCGVHTDWGALTILAQDEIGGLEIRRPSGEWVAATPIPDTFVVNIGDLMARWTNELYASTPHRVLNRSAYSRYSAAFFANTNYHALIECLPTCCSPHRPRRYPPILAGEHLNEMKRKSYGVAA